MSRNFTRALGLMLATAALLSLGAWNAHAAPVGEEILTSVNSQRASASLPALRSDATLDAAAQEWAETMARTAAETNNPRYLEHSSSEWRAARIPAGWRSNGENIALGYRSSADVMAGWMNSPGHRANILNTSYTRLGVGHVAGTNYWVQIFAGYASDTAPTVPALPTSRIAGADRFAVANAISRDAYPQGADTVFIATGANYPDALSAAPAAVKLNAPLLLTYPGELPASVSSEIQRLEPQTIVVVGGTASVSASVVADLEPLAENVVRVSGTDRFATSRAIANYAFDDGASTAYIATGANFPDALAAGSAAGTAGAPVVLVNGNISVVDDATARLLGDLGSTSVKIAGGPVAVSASIATSLGANGRTVTRLSGDDRFATAVALNQDALRTSRTVYLATGHNFPDALAGSVLAGARDSALLLAHTNCVPSSVLSSITALGANRVVLFGGTAALDGNVAALAACR
jgi:putative cell wall-binding protein